MHIKVRDIKTGAIYRYGCRKHWSVEQIAAALVERVGFKASTAACIARHWYGTDPYRSARAEAA